MKTITLIPIIVCLCIGFIATAQDELPQLTNEEALALMERWQNNEFRNQISGSIFDSQTNEPLTDVIATITENREIFSGDINRYELIISTSPFLITSQPCMQMSVTFDKKGYYTETVSTHNAMDYMDGYATKTDDDIIITPPVTIMLEPIGDTLSYTQVLRLDTVIRVQKNGTNMEMSYIIFPFEGLEPKLYRHLNYFPNEAALPESIIYVWPELKPDEEFSGAWLKTSVPESGFILAPNIKNRNDFFRKMKTAPESGYSSAVYISEENLGKNRYFYIKIGGMYGKGTIDVSNSNKNANLLIYLNKDIDGENPRQVK